MSDYNLKYSKALFLDRDGTILKEIPADNPDENDTFGYITEISQVELIPGAAESIALARNLGFKIIIISNQSAIARGWISEEILFQINEEMYRQLREANPSAIVDDFFFSPYHTDGVIEKYKKDSPTRKPDIGMILEAKKKHNIDLTKSYFIGDSYSDMKCAENANLKKILVLTGYGKTAYNKCLEDRINLDFIADNLLFAVEFLKNIKKE